MYLFQNIKCWKPVKIKIRIPGKHIKIKPFDVEADNGDVDLEVSQLDNTEIESITITGDAAAATYVIVYTSTGATDKLQADNMGAGEILRIGKITVQKFN